MKIGVIESDTPIINNAQEALDIAMSLCYNHDCRKLAVNKEALCEDFFILSTGIAGEILQKLVNYHVSIGIYGDFSGYTSKPLKDFMYESNLGTSVCFTKSLDEALKKLSL